MVFLFVVFGFAAFQPDQAKAIDRLCPIDMEQFALNHANTDLVGTLYKETFYGPPGWGEDKQNDSLRTAYFLRLDSGINIEGDSESPALLCEMVIQIEGADEISKYAPGTRIKIRGALGSAHTGYQRTNAFIIPDTISEAR
jgi:hypothetical protein